MNEFEKNNLVSIIMPSYNSSRYIEDSIKSIVTQSYKNWELLIIDDGSTDESVNIIMNFCKTDKRIKLYKNRVNKGVSKTRNLGIDKAKGNWIAFLDSDDIWEKTKLQKQIDFYKKTGSGFIFTGAKYIDENGQLYKGVFEIPEIVSYKNLLSQNVITCSSVLIKRDIIGEHKMERDDIHEDFAFWLKILKEVNYAYGINEQLLIYRICKNSKSGNKIKSLIMAYKTYKYMGINSIVAVFYMQIYILKNLKKYSIIKKIN